MKIIAILLAFMLVPFNAYSQVSIGKSSISSASVSLEFGNVSGDASKQKGILLPWVESASVVQAASAVPGTLIFDTTDKKIKYYKETNTTPIWFDLTVDNTGVADTSLQSSLVERTDARVSIGTPTATPGILVLEDTDKAMVLPLVDKYSSVVNPSPGMMVYDLSNDMLCFYNGKVWSFWKP
ncbi:hypothetical protein [Chryseobacterium sp. SC28]|uniref:hypothetical protein n=1 Tax=Chryseobacterium sp. SC28 TaxID=2268028 RepID=UPI000F650D6E|nr:hypothetical protein [Chryseobacterium sp. SC28]RRQ45831.1 hypothetical protein DTW91_07890 [Chryseobacterium sp. SC28]